MYHHVIRAQEVTKPVDWRTHHSHHLFIDSAAALLTAMLLSDCAFEGANDNANFAMSFTPYTSNCLEDEFGC